jgi:hypothetical protein
MLSAQSPDAPPTRLNDLSDAAFFTKIRKVPGAGYSSSSVEGVEAKALLAQVKATAKKGRTALEDVVYVLQNLKPPAPALRCLKT